MEQKYGGCPFCQKTVPVFWTRGHYLLEDHEDDAVHQPCEGSYCEPEGVTK